MKFFGKKENNNEETEDFSEAYNGAENTLEQTQEPVRPKTAGIPTVMPYGAHNSSINSANTPSHGDSDEDDLTYTPLSSPESLAKASQETLDDQSDVEIDEDETLTKIESSALMKDKEPVLEILTPAVSSGTASEDKSRLLQEAENGRSDDEETTEKNSKKRSSIFNKRRKKDDTSSDSLDTKFNSALETDDEDDNDEDTPEKKKRSLSEMTLKDLLPGKKEKTELKIPVGENILIDLMPQSHKDIVSVRNARKNWSVIFASVIVICVAASGGTFAYNLHTQSLVRTEQAKQESLDIDIAKHAEVNQALQSEGQAKELLSSAAGIEINWNELISTIQNNLPSGTRISSLNVTTGGTVNDEVSSAITMNLTSDSTLGYSDALRAVEDINGVQQVEIGGLTGGEGGYTYTMSFTFDTSILTERFVITEEIAPEEITDENGEPTGVVEIDDPNLTTILDDPDAEIMNEEE